ncbi:MAG: hypothetical protein F6K40_33695 [Okeania sp. SIO3I5]|uniref:hypothetical protein n=1 Tax=Okeania sp. SIO3I5 TaxID=2607805 RepID=UPI0013B7B29C|nr:hypothetical protein [Okeania sp. SIO3I5]NEQ40904.1 hypothetical protein [Okeania sp. SIO3I5]
MAETYTCQGFKPLNFFDKNLIKKWLKPMSGKAFSDLTIGQQMNKASIYRNRVI